MMRVRVTTSQQRNRMIVFPQLAVASDERLSTSRDASDASGRNAKPTAAVDEIEFRCVTFTPDTTRQVLDVLRQHRHRVRRVALSSCYRFTHDDDNEERDISISISNDSDSDSDGQGDARGNDFRRVVEDVADQCLTDLFLALADTDIGSLKIINSPSLSFPTRGSSHWACRWQTLLQQLIRDRLSELTISLPGRPNAPVGPEYDTAVPGGAPLHSNSSVTAHVPFQYLLDGIETSSTLRSLCMWGGTFERRHVDGAAAADKNMCANVVGSFRRNVSLRRVEFKFTCLSDSLMADVCAALSHHPNLVSLTLSGSECSHRTFESLADLLAPSVSTSSDGKARLSMLDLSNLRLLVRDSSHPTEHRFHSIHTFFRSIASNKTLKELRLSAFDLSDASGCIPYLAWALHHNSTLRRLDVSSCRISNNGIATLIHELRISPDTRLEDWNIKFNRFVLNVDTSQMILRLLECNVFLRSIQTTNELSPRIVHWMTLNRCGRQLLRSPGVTAGIWPHVLKRTDDRSALFYFLRNQPQLFRTVRAEVGNGTLAEQQGW